MRSIPKVAVLMATYNGAPHIFSQIASVLWQLFVHVDVYIRDDASTDRTAEAVIEAFPDSRIYLIHDPLGPSDTYQRGAALNFYRLIASDSVLASDYDWVAFSDQDDIWLPDKLCSAINHCVQTSTLAWSSSVLAYWVSSGRAAYIPKHGKISTLNYLFESPGPGCTIVLRSDVFADLQTFLRDNFASLHHIEFHDWLVYAFVSNNYGSWFISPTAPMLYRQHSLNVAGAGMSLSQIAKKISLVYSGWYREQILLLSALFSMDNHPIIVLLKRFGFWDRVRLPFLLWPHRRRIKDRFLLFSVLPFSAAWRVSRRVY
jgi:rhamnosyltransferase